MIIQKNHQFLEFSYKHFGVGSKQNMIRGGGITHSFFVQSRGNNPSECYFQSFHDISAFIKYHKLNDNLFKEQEKNFFFNEIYTKNNRVFEFYDLDVSNSHFFNSEKLFNTFYKIYSSYCSSLNLQHSNKDIRILDASKGSKLSLHIINRKRCFENPTKLKIWYDAFKDYVQKEYPEYLHIIDWGVAKKAGGALRMIYSSKPGENRPFLPARFHHPSHNDKDNIYSFFITNCNSLNPFREVDFLNQYSNKIKRNNINLLPIEHGNSTLSIITNFINNHLNSAFSLEEHENKEFIVLKRNTSSTCFFDPKRTHHRRDSWIRISNKGIFYGCFCENSQSTLIGNIHSHINPTPTQIINSQNVGSYIERLQNTDILCIKSNMMTEKTQNLKSLCNLYPKILMVSFRTSLKDEYMKNFYHLKFKDYSTFKGTEIKAERLVVQIDSLWKVRGQFDLIILDEIEYTTNHFFGFVKNKTLVYDALSQYISSNAKIIALDAFLSNNIVEWLKSFKRNVHVIENTFKSFKNQETVIYSKKNNKNIAEQFLAFVKKMVELGKNVVCPVSSLTVGEKLKVMLDNINVKVELISSITEKIPTSDWGNYQVLIYTPSVVAGLSFGTKGEVPHFDECICYFTSSSCEAKLATQMMFRVRSIKNSKRYVFLNQHIQNNPLPINDDELDTYIYSSIYDISNVKIKINHLNEQIVKDDYYKLYRYYLKEVNLSKTQFMLKLEEYLRTQGMDITIKDEEFDSTLDDNLTDFMKHYLDKKNELILDAKTITYDEYQRLKFQYEKTLEEQFSIQKYILQNTYKVPVTKQLIIELGSKESISRFKNLCYLNTNFNSIKDHLVSEIESQFSESTKNTHLLHLSKRYRRLYITIQTLELLGIESIHDHKVLDPEPDKIVAFLNKYESSIRSATGWKEHKFDVNDMKKAYNYIKNILNYCSLSLQRCGKGNKRRRLTFSTDYEKYGIEIDTSPIGYISNINVCYDPMMLPEID